MQVQRVSDPDWLTQLDSLAADSPFTDARFWRALRRTSAIGGRTDWQPEALVLQAGQQTQAVLPLFFKQANRGEYVFDYAWGHAHQRLGIDYTPRLVTAVPFSPVTGQRIWLRDPTQLEQAIPSLMNGLRELITTASASSWHCLFLNDTQRAALLAQDVLPLFERTNCQFLWTDAQYGDFEGFLGALTAKRRKAIRVERQRVKDQGIRCQWYEGNEVDATLWLRFHECYVMTYRERGQRPYLSLAFFQQIGRTMPEKLALNVAYVGDEPVAMALFFKDQETLYGRYWGSLIHADALHFEVCYYQGIEYALQQGLERFDPGTQGEHKLIRGFAPVLTHSLHYIAHPRLREAIAHACQHERAEVQAYFEAAQSALPFKQTA